jgi:molybdenum cofactor guanylyltransferase
VDKSLLVYADKPQRYHIYEMIEAVCTKVFISCNTAQMKTMDESYPCIIDLPAYTGIGPMAGLLSAFEQFPGTDFLVIGCDYPFLKQDTLDEFITSIDKKDIAVSFYNDTGKLYEPMLAWYSYRSAEILKSMFDKKEYSLQYFLKTNKTGKFYPPDEKLIKSVDTMEGYYAAVNELNKNANAPHLKNISNN